MKFSEYCDMVENTEQEQQLFEFMRNDSNMQEAWTVMEKMQTMPVIGKIITALGELGDAESIAAFRQTEHYPHIMNFEFNFDPDKGDFSLAPSVEQQKIMKMVFAAIVAGIVLLVVCCKLRRRR